MNNTPTLKQQAADLGINYEAFLSRIRYRGSVEAAIDFIPKITISFPINGIDLTLAEWCHYLGVTYAAVHRCAKRRNLNSLEELQRRFQERPDLFPKHLLDPNHPRYHEVKAKTTE